MLRAERCVACGSEYHLPGPGSSTCGPSCESQHGDAMVGRVGPTLLTCCFIWIASQIPLAKCRPHTMMISNCVCLCFRTRCGRCSPPTWPGSACWRAPWSPAAPSSPGWRSTTGETGEWHLMKVSIIECFGSEGYRMDQIKTFSLREYILNSCFISNLHISGMGPRLWL